MDLFHIFLILIIMINNIPFFKKYYYPFFFAITKKFIKNLNIFQKNWKEIYIFKKKDVNYDRKINNFYLNNKNHKSIQKKLSWNFQIAVMNLNSNLNIGAIYRSGCLLGMNKYIILGKKIYNPKSQVGLNFVPIEYLDVFKNIRDRDDPKTIEELNIILFQDYIKKNNLIPVLVEQEGKNLLDINFHNLSESIHNEEKLLFVFGNETHGISNKLIKLAKIKKWLIITIPQWGCAHSFNVSQAANIIMWKFYQDNIIYLRKHFCPSY